MIADRGQVRLVCVTCFLVHKDTFLRPSLLRRENYLEARYRAIERSWPDNLDHKIKINGSASFSYLLFYGSMCLRY